MERRTFLSTSGVSVLALAAASTTPSTDAVSNDPADVVREYYRRGSGAATVREFAAEIPELAHSTSPLLDVAETAPRILDGALDQEVMDLEVIEENASSAEIREFSDFFVGSVSEADIETIARTNAIVAVTLASDDVIGGEFAVEWLVAPENGAWRLVWFGTRNGPRAAARRVFRRIKQAESFEALDDPIAAGTHSVSPLVNVVEYTPWYFRGLRRRTLTRTAVRAENVGTETIVSEFTPFADWASREEVESIAGENAVVAMTLQDERLGVEEFDRSWLVAPDRGEWQVVWF